jgi:hypothetical protein
MHRSSCMTAERILVLSYRFRIWGSRGMQCSDVVGQRQGLSWLSHGNWKSGGEKKNRVHRHLLSRAEPFLQN